MKKVISLILVLCTVLAPVSCTRSENVGNTTESSYTEPDSPSGSDATFFDKGDGSAASPYEISSAQQLAYLSDDVRGGNTYEGKYIKLVQDIDLEDYEWTPIGLGDNIFKGHFDGSLHTVSNLKITKLHVYEAKYAQSTKLDALAGLFGRCEDATIKNLTVEKATFSLQTPNELNRVFVGIVAGAVNTDTQSEISNIKVFDSSADISGSFYDVVFGGVSAYVNSSNATSLTTSKLQAEVSLSVENSNAHNFHLGGVVGEYINGAPDINCSNICSDFSVNMGDKNVEFDYCIGSVGYAFSVRGTCFDISNVFSVVRVFGNDLFMEPSIRTYPIYVHAIIGGQGIGHEAAIKETYGFKNLFGYSELNCKKDNSTITEKTLFERNKDDIYTEENCMGTAILPSHHGFAESVWNLTDLANPKLN